MKDTGILILTTYVSLTSFLIGYGFRVSFEHDGSSLQWEVLLTGLTAILAGYLAIHAASMSLKHKESKEAIRFAGKVRRTIGGSIKGIEGLATRLHSSPVAPENIRDVVSLTREIAPEPNQFTPLELQLSYDQLAVSLNQADGYNRSHCSSETEAIFEVQEHLKVLLICLRDLDRSASKWYSKAMDEMYPHTKPST
jgi:hypothetical protein